MKFKKEDVNLSRQIGFDKTASSIGANNRSVKRALIKKYKKYFTEEEVKELKQMSIEDLNKKINLRVGKFK